MPRRSGSFSKPFMWLAQGEWPDGTFEPDAPEAVAYAVHIARNLSEHLEGVNKKQFATDAGIDRSTLYDLIAGNTWADVVTLAKLERVLGVSLWPTEPPTLRRAPIAEASEPVTE